MNISPKEVKGFATWEMMAVLAISSVIVFAGLQSYKTYRTHGEIEDSKAKLQEIFLGLNEYFYRNCRNASLNPQPTPAALVSGGLVSSLKRFSDPIGGGQFQPSIIWGAPVRLKVDVSIGTRGGAAAWAQTLDATSVSGSILSWIRPAGVSYSVYSDMGREFQHMYEPTIPCSG